MDTENNRCNVRITSAAILASVGVAFMSRLPQLLPGQQAVLWYQSGFFWAGIAIVVIALLILILPPKSWRKIWQSVLGFPTWLRETYIWQKYGPKCTIEIPAIDFELYLDEQMRRYSTHIFLTVFISEKTSKYCPVRCSFRNMTFQLEQKHGLILLRAPLELNPVQSLEYVLNTPGKTTYKIGLSWFPCNNPAILFVDTQKSYKCVIKDVHVYLDNLKKYRKLSRKGWISNAEKT